MKIGILTFHRCINYGSYWQARFLLEAVQRFGHQAVILNHQSKRVDFAEWKCALQPVLPTPVPPSDHALYRHKIEKFLTQIEALPLSAPFSLEDPSSMEEYDLVIVGSDEVWNLSHPWYGYYPIFFGQGIRTKKLISYAASFGNYNPSWNLDQDWIKKLLRFDEISVRDQTSKYIIQNALGNEPKVVLDPCLLFPYFSIEEVPLLSNPTIAVVYGHNFSEKMIRFTLYWAKLQRIKLVSIGYRNDWADEQQITADPLEFASLIIRSKAVITNFFHGCIFSLINHKSFVCETSAYRSNKIQDLMKSLDAEKHLLNSIQSDDQFEELLMKPADEKVYDTINRLRRDSEEWLDQALTLKKRMFYGKAIES